MHNGFQKSTIQKYRYEILLALLTFCFMLVFNRSSSPFNLVSGYDESVFKLFGLMISKGSVPLRDYVDRKGPWLCFINAIPYLTHTYRFGLFVIQFALTYITSLLVFKAISKFIEPKIAILSLAGMYLFYSICYSEGNACESYALFFITVSMYLCWKFISQKRPIHEHPYSYTFVYGISFGIIAFIRPNDVASICGIVLACAYLLIRKKKITKLFSHVGVFVLGMVLSVSPVILYYGINHAIYDMIYWTFIEGFSYNSASRNDAILAYMLRLFSFIPLFITVYLAWINDRKNNMTVFPFAVLITFFQFMAIGVRNSGHYFIVILPFYAVAIAYLLSIKNRLALLILFCHFFSKFTLSEGSRDNGFIFSIRSAFLEISNNSFMRDYNNRMKSMYESVPESERGNIYANVWQGMSFYVVNRTLPPNKWFILNPGVDLDSMRETVRYVLYETDDEWRDTGKPLVQGFHEVSCIDASKHPRHSFMLHLLEKD